MAQPSEESIFEEREALMVSPTGRIPTLRNAHFIKPTANSINGPNLKLPFVPFCSETAWPLSVSFNGWYAFLKKWPIWVSIMQKKYEFIWKKSGIYDAILASTYRIRRNNELIFGVAERWCCETSSFLFPWAEATITLEDMMILGGFSVLGSPFSMPLETRELVEIEEGLMKSMKWIMKSNKSGTNAVSHCEWIDYLMDSGDELEHEAFLSLWLSRFVLPGNVFDAINKDNFSIAIYLARGIRIALAPVVLASLYRDLSLLKETILVSYKTNVVENESNYIALTLWSPFQFVQIWAWERLPLLQPKPKVISRGEPRLARWHGVNWLKHGNLRLLIDSAGESFLWRPYAISVDDWFVPGFYKEKEEWVLSDRSLSAELESFARCMRVSQLVGTDSIEVYLPHRVGMQFGMDQDLPLWIPKFHTTSEVAWENYNRPLAPDTKLYFPCRLFEADVTTRYMEWWKKSVLNLQLEIKGLLRGLRSLRVGGAPDFPRKCHWGKRILQIWNDSAILNREEITDTPSLAVKHNCLTSSIEGNDPDTPPGFPPKIVMGKKRLRTSNKRGILDSSDGDTEHLLVEENGFTTWTEGNDNPPDLPPKRNKQSIQDSLDVDVMPFAAVGSHSFPSSEGSSQDFSPGFTAKHNQVNEMVQTYNVNSYKSRLIDDDNPFTTSKMQHLCSSTEDNGCLSRMIESLSKPMGMAKQSESATRNPEPACAIADSHEINSESSIQNKGVSNYEEDSNYLSTQSKHIDLETRISVLEKVLARLKAARSLCVKQELEG